MKNIELKDNYLINIGESLEDKYTYIKESKHDYSSKEMSKESVQINGKDIKLERNIANNSVLYNVLYGAGNAYISTVNSEILNAPNKSGKSLETICSTAFSKGKSYFADYLKYFAKEIKMEDTNYQLLMSLVDTHIVKLAEQITAIRQGHSTYISKAEDRAEQGKIQSNLQTIAEINNAPKYGYSTTHANPSMFGTGVNAYTFGTTYSTVSQSELKAAEMGASMLADFEIKIASESAYDDAVASIKVFVKDLVYSFCAKVTELLYVKQPKLFAPSINTSNDLTINPINLKSWVELVDNLNADDYPKLKEIFEYYHLDISTSLGLKVKDNMIKHYDEKRTCDYNGNDLKVYLFLNNIQTPKQSQYLSSWLYASSLKRLNATFKAHKSDNTMRVSHAETALADAKLYAYNCEYLNEEDLKRFDVIYEKLLKVLKNEYKSNKSEFIMKASAWTIVILIVGGIVWLFSK